MEVKFAGPYRLTDVILTPEACERGVYLLTMPMRQSHHLVYYAGETGSTLAREFISTIPTSLRLSTAYTRPKPTGTTSV